MLYTYLDLYYSYFASVCRAGLLSKFYRLKDVVIYFLNMSKTIGAFTRCTNAIAVRIHDVNGELYPCREKFGLSKF